MNTSVWPSSAAKHALQQHKQESGNPARVLGSTTTSGQAGNRQQTSTQMTCIAVMRGALLLFPLAMNVSPQSTSQPAERAHCEQEFVCGFNTDDAQLHIAKRSVFRLIIAGFKR
jgi:hypothetical protein